MNYKNIISGFDDYAKAKKNNTVILYVSFVFAAFVIVAVLFWAFNITNSAINKVVVVERSGEYLKINAENNEKLFLTLIKNTCATATHYINSFDRITIRENQAKAAFYANKDDLKTIFLKYQNDGSYHEAIENGVVYKCEIEEFDTVLGTEQPYKVFYTSILKVYYSQHVTTFRITSQGEIIKVTPQYPENVTGYFLKSLSQKIEKIQ